MLTHLTLKDFVIVDALDVSLAAGFTALTGETGAGKSILVDALQLALGERADAGVVREGAARAEISATFELPASLAPLLDDAGIETGDELLLRRVVDAQGRSRAFINGSAATLTQLRAVAAHLVDIHGQHAWQSLTEAPAVRALLDDVAGAAPLARATAQAHAAWKQAAAALADATAHQAERVDAMERLQWQLGELDKLAPQPDEWAALSDEHSRLAHAQSLIDAATEAAQWLGDEERGAQRALARSVAALDAAVDFDAARLAPLRSQLADAQALLADAERELASYASRAEVDPARLAQADERLATWLSLARRFRSEPAELPALREQWQAALAALDAQADLSGLAAQVQAARAAWQQVAGELSAARRAAAPPWCAAVTAAMQTLGMTGGAFEVGWLAQSEPQAFGLESAELRVAGHAGVAARPLAKVASGGELSRLALAIAVTSLTQRGKSGKGGEGAPGDAQPLPATLIFDEVDAGIGGAVADTVGQLLRRLGQRVQVLAVTHLPQVAACAHQHWVVAKHTQAGRTTSQMQAVAGSARAEEIARMLGGARSAHGTRLAHAQALLEQAAP